MHVFAEIEWVHVQEGDTLESKKDQGPFLVLSHCYITRQHEFMSGNF